MQAALVMEWSEPGGAWMRIPWGHGACKGREIWTASIANAECVCVCECVPAHMHMSDLSTMVIAEKLGILKVSALSTKLYALWWESQEAARCAVTRSLEELLSLYWLKKIPWLG